MIPNRILLAAAIAGLFATGAHAHPMGNFTINHYSRLTVERSSLRLHYVLDMAELPTVVERQDMDKDGNNDVSDTETAAYLKDRTPRWLGNLKTTVDEKSVLWSLKGARVHFTPGVANLAVLRIDLDAVAPLSPGEHRIVYVDDNYPERPGWKEMVVTTAPGVPAPTGRAPNQELSRELHAYPNALVGNPPQDASADFTVDIAPPVSPKPAIAPSAPSVHLSTRKPIAPSATPAQPYVPWTALLGIDQPPTVQRATPVTKAASPAPIPAKARAVPAAPVPAAPATSAMPAPAPSRWSRMFHALVNVKHITPSILLASLLIAFLLGGIHALQPGHGKTLVAAYLVGQRGTARHAVLLGITVTISHTFGVFLLGAVALYGSQFILPEVLQPWMGFASGALVALIGGSMLFARLREVFHERAHSHAHASGGPHEHHHHHHDHSGSLTHSHGPSGKHTHAPPESISLKSLLALGISGGIVPCPDALIVLLGAVAIHQTLYGMALILAFSAGLAATLTAAGLAVVWGQQRTALSRLTPSGVRLVSIIGNVIVLAIGVAIAVQSLVSGNIIQKAG